MRLLFWVTALAVLSIAWAKNSTTKAKPKRQLDNLRSPQNLQYSLVLPHSRVSHYRALNNNNRRISHGARGGKLPPYAVQMEPVVQYSQKDPLYDPTHDNLDDSIVNQNQIYAQSKILNTHDSHESFGPPYGSLPTAPLYSHEPHPHYIEAPEPIIEIIIKESNETLPAPPPQPVQKKKKEPVHVFYVKYSKDPNSHDKVIYDAPIPAITPSTNDEEEEHHHEEYVTVTPEPYIPRETTTLRALIKPESEQYHSDSSVRITFGNEGRHYSDRREGSHGEDREETAPRPAIAFPSQGPQQGHPQLERQVSSQPQFSHETELKSSVYHPNSHTYRPNSQHAQSRIQFQPQSFPVEQQLPRQNPPNIQFRQPHNPRNPFGSSPSLIPNPAFSNGPPGLISHFSGPTVSTPVGPTFQPAFPRANGPSFNSRPSSAPSFGPRPTFNGPPRSNFHPGSQRPFHQPQPQPQPQSKPFFDEAKYLQENYHTITTDQVDPPKEQILPNRPPPTFNRSPQGPSAAPQFQEHFSRPQIIPNNQQLPQQRPAQHFENKPSASPFFNLKPSPPLIENNRPSFQSSPQFSFHQGPQIFPGPSPSASPQGQHSFSSPVSASPSSIPQNQFLSKPSSPSVLNFQPQPSPTPDHFFQRPNSPSERPQFQQSQGPSERPPFYPTPSPSERPSFNHHSHFRDQHQDNIRQVVPNGGELIPAIPKYEQHITVNSNTGQTEYNLLGESRPLPTPSTEQRYQQQKQLQYQQQQREQQHREQQQSDQQQREQQHREQQQREQQQREQQQREQQYREQEKHREQQEQKHRQQQQQQYQQQLQQQQIEAEQEQVRQQLAQNVQKQQEEIQRLQAQLYHSQQQEPQISQYNQQIETSSPRSQYIQERSRYQSSTSPPQYYQSTPGTVEIKPTTQKYVSSTINSISSTSKPTKDGKKKKPAFELPDEVPDDLRQQLLSSGILDNADISVLDYDKVGDTPLDSLPPDQLANFFSAGGGQQIAASENRPVYVKPDGDRIESRNIDDDDDQEIAASENVPDYVAAPPSDKQAVEMKVVHFNPNTIEGQNKAKDYIQENATQVDPVALNDKKYNRYLPLKVSGNQFPLPDILKGRRVTSVVVLAPVETEALGEHSRKERSTNNLKGIKFVAGDSLQDLLKKPTKDNFEKWLTVEKKTSADLQSIVLLVTGNEAPEEDKEIFMYDIATGNVNKLSGDLSSAFVEAAENNSLSKNIEQLAIEGDGIPENFQKDEIEAEGSENVPLFVDLSGVSLDDANSNSVSISSSYSKTKHGRLLRQNH